MKKKGKVYPIRGDESKAGEAKEEERPGLAPGLYQFEVSQLPDDLATMMAVDQVTTTLRALGVTGLSDIGGEIKRRISRRAAELGVKPSRIIRPGN